MKTVFFGTPAFAVPTLAALVDAGLAPALVVSQPARPAGRGRKLVEPPVAAWARDRGLPVEQPLGVRDPAFMARMTAMAPDVAVVVAFGQIFKQALLDLPRLGCINLHASLLPRWRGAAPIQAAIAHGDPETGVTTMCMEAGLDTGPMLLQETVTIRPDDTTSSLGERLAAIGGPLMVETLRGLDDGTVTPVRQDDDGVTLAPRLTKADGVVDWQQPATTLHDRWRAYTPWPATTARFAAAVLKLVTVAVPGTSSSDDAVAATPGKGAQPGTVLGLAGDGVDIACGAGTVLRLLRVQRPGRQAVAAVDWYHGERITPGATFDVVA